MKLLILPIDVEVGKIRSGDLCSDRRTSKSIHRIDRARLILDLLLHLVEQRLLRIDSSLKRGSAGASFVQTERFKQLRILSTRLTGLLAGLNHRLSVDPGLIQKCREKCRVDRLLKTGSPTLQLLDQLLE